MVDEVGGESGSGAPRAIVRSRARPSIVWFIPMVAAVVGLYLAYWAWSEQGPTIEIVFASAEGLIAGQTKLKYKDVEVGLVEAVDLTEDLARVRVTASMVKELAGYMTDKTRFWVVRAEVSAAEISGVDTLLSGAYIGVDPSNEGRRTSIFEGLEKTPVVRSDKPGTLFNLRARELGSVDVGSPVYYRWLRVGQIAGYQLDDHGDAVNVQVFVEAPHDERVRSTTRFWNASGLDATVTAEGVQIDTPSLMSMLVGGIAFETPATVTVAEDVPENMVFELYSNKQATRRPRYLLKSRFMLYFDDSVAGLVSGSPVEFRGIKLGEVLDVDIDFDRDTTEMRIPVVIEIEPERLGLTHADVEENELALMQSLVDKGLRASLATNNMLTGQKAIDFDFLPGAKHAEIETDTAYPVLPTVSGGIDALTERITRIVDRVDQVPIDSIGKNLDEVFRNLAETLRTVEEIAQSANKDLLPKLAGSLAGLETTLDSASSLISPDSAMAQELETLVGDLAEAASSLKLLAERLEEHPEELLRGKGE